MKAFASPNFKISLEKLNWTFDIGDIDDSGRIITVTPDESMFSNNCVLELETECQDYLIINGELKAKKGKMFNIGLRALKRGNQQQLNFTVKKFERKGFSKPIETELCYVNLKYHPIINAIIIGKQDVEILELIGAGSFGEVYKGRYNNQIVAIKKVECNDEEYKLLRSLNHPNIIKVIAAFSDDNYNNIIMEYAEKGSLNNCKGILEDLAKIIIMNDVCQGLKYLHSIGMIHRDVKPANILLMYDSKESRIIGKLSDFGTAKFLEKTLQTSTAKGSGPFMAPEVLSGKVCFKSDVFSLGVTMMICFNDESAQTSKNKDTKYESLNRLIRRCVEGTVSRRIDIEDIEENLRHITDEIQIVSSKDLNVSNYCISVGPYSYENVIGEIIELFDELMDKRNDLISIVYYIKYNEFIKHDYEEMSKLLSKYIEEPHGGETEYLLYNIHKRLGEQEKAIEYLSEASKKLHPEAFATSIKELQLLQQKSNSNMKNAIHLISGMVHKYPFLNKGIGIFYIAGYGVEINVEKSRISFEKYKKYTQIDDLNLELWMHFCICQQKECKEYKETMMGLCSYIRKINENEFDKSLKFSIKDVINNIYLLALNFSESITGENRRVAYKEFKRNYVEFSKKFGNLNYEERIEEMVNSIVNGNINETLIICRVLLNNDINFEKKFNICLVKNKINVVNFDIYVLSLIGMLASKKNIIANDLLIAYIEGEFSFKMKKQFNNLKKIQELLKRDNVSFDFPVVGSFICEELKGFQLITTSSKKVNKQKEIYEICIASISVNDKNGLVVENKTFFNIPLTMYKSTEMESSIERCMQKTDKVYTREQLIKMFNSMFANSDELFVTEDQEVLGANFKIDNSNIVSMKVLVEKLINDPEINLSSLLNTSINETHSLNFEQEIIECDYHNSRPYECCIARVDKIIQKANNFILKK